jgi:hypothetical protein
VIMFDAVLMESGCLDLLNLCYPVALIEYNLYLIGLPC